MIKKMIAECFGTFTLTFIACGVAVLSGADFVATSFAFGLVIVAMAYTIGNITGCHINPAVSLAMAIRKEITWKEFGLYVLSQVVGAFLGSLLLALCLRGFGYLGANTIQNVLYNHNDGKLDFLSYFGAFVAEVVLTFIFVFVIVGVTDKKFGNGKFAGIIIGLTLALVHLIGLRLTGTSVNPARSLAPAVLTAFTGDTTSLSQIWIWILAPMAGGALAAVAYGFLFDKNKDASDNLNETK